METNKVETKKTETKKNGAGSEADQYGNGGGRAD